MNGKAWLLRWRCGLGQRFVNTVSTCIPCPASQSRTACLTDSNLSYPFALNCVSPHHPFQDYRLQRKGRIHIRSPSRPRAGAGCKARYPWSPYFLPISARVEDNFHPFHRQGNRRQAQRGRKTDYRMSFKSGLAGHCM